MLRPVFLCLAVIAVAGMPLNSSAADTSAQFCDNGVFVNKAQLARAALRLTDPKWHDQSQAFLARVKGYAKVHPSPYKGRSAWQFLDSGRKDIMPAMDLALFATIASGEDRQAAGDTAKKILLAWARDSAFAGQFSMGEPKDAKEKQDFAGLGLYAGLMGIGATHTYHLLKCNGYLSADESRVVVDWLRRISENVLEGRKRWETHNYFAQPIGNNHISVQNAALYGIAVVINDAELQEWVLRSPANRTSFTRMLDLAIYNGRERVEMKPDTVGAIPNRGEITDRYRMAMAKNGLHYALFHLVALTLTAEVGANQGVDLYQLKATNGESLADPLLFYGEFFAHAQCSTSVKPVVRQGPKGFEYYAGANVEPYYWIWVEPLLNRLAEQRAIAALAERVRKTSCRISPPQYLPIPLSTLTHGGD